MGADFDGTRPDMGAIILQNNEETIYIDFTADVTTLMADPTATVNFTRWIVPFNCVVQSVEWNWGDGMTTTLNVLSHTYLHGGTFTVCLTAISNNNVTYTCSKEKYLRIYSIITANSLTGTLTAEFSPYYTNHTISVDTGSSLTIEAGVELYLGTDASFNLTGQVNAAGTNENRILITGYEGQLPYEIHLTGFAPKQFQYCTFQKFYWINTELATFGQAAFENCVIENNTFMGIQILSGYVAIRNCTLHNNRLNLSTAATEGLIENNLLTGNVVVSLYVNGGSPNLVIKNNIFRNGLPEWAAIYLESNSSATIRDNDISMHGTGILLLNNCYGYILNNELHDNYAGIGLYMTSSDPQTYIQGNLIYNNLYTGILHIDSSAEISNNTIVNNNTSHAATYGGICFSYSCFSHIVNNIIYGNTNDFYREDSNSVPEVSYNLTELSLPATVTNMGNNVVGNPGFVSDTDFRLSSTSPCIDTGNPDSTYYALLQYDMAGFPRLFDGDNDGTAVIDRGCYEYNPSQANDDDVIPVSDLLQVKVFPNPFKSWLNISFATPKSGAVKISIYNIKGELVKSLADKTFSKGPHTISWDGTDKSGRSIATGIYFCSIKTEKNSTTRKLILRK